MSPPTASSLSYLPRSSLASTLRTTTLTPTSALAVIDVRDSDHIGGHIRGSQHVPSNTLDYKIPELVRTLAEKETVVFHCTMSQQRGPSAALRYLRERERVGAGGEGAGGDDREAGKGQRQKVYVLDGGFAKWQEDYGRDEGLTEGWVRDVWDWGRAEEEGDGVTRWKR